MPTPPESRCQEPQPQTGTFSRTRLRESAAACFEYNYCLFEEAAEVLSNELDDALSSSFPSATVQTAWRNAMHAWSVLEVMQVGPAASAAPTAGKDNYQGQGKRDLIYSWPQVARCRVDEQVALERYKSLGISSVGISGRGMFGLETLLFYPGSDTACSQNSTTADVWATFDAKTLQGRRLDYARALGQDVLGQARELSNAWASNADFRAKFVDASAYPDEQEAMNVLGWALIYVEREVKDWKLGVPTGVAAGAPVSQVEAFYAGDQSSLLSQNIRGFRLLFEGCSANYEGIGFDDWLRAAGHEDLAEDIIEAASGAEARFASLPRFAEATPSDLEAAYAAIKQLTDLLKADLFGAGSPLNLKLPASVEGDTD